MTGNGDGPKVTATLTLTFDILAQRLDIKGEMPCYETALDMLARATRHFEGLLRFEQMMAFQRQEFERSQAQAIARDLRRQ